MVARTERLDVIHLPRIRRDSDEAFLTDASIALVDQMPVNSFVDLNATLTRSAAVFVTQ
jgi:hypothetical protein